MKEEEWEKFWKYLLERADNLNTYFLLDYWLEDQREAFEE